jgi:hypothetical protein
MMTHKKPFDTASSASTLPASMPVSSERGPELTRAARTTFNRFDGRRFAGRLK